MGVFEVPADFAKRVGLPYAEILRMVKQGKLPYMPCGKYRYKVHIEAGIDALRKIAEESAEIKLDRQPILPVRKKPSGRPPDSVRLKNMKG